MSLPATPRTISPGAMTPSDGRPDTGKDRPGFQNFDQLLSIFKQAVISGKLRQVHLPDSEITVRKKMTSAELRRLVDENGGPDSEHYYVTTVPNSYA